MRLPDGLRIVIVASASVNSLVNPSHQTVTQQKTVTMKSAILLMLLLPVALAGTDDDGYDLFYQSNREEMNDEPITFDPPLPNWLSGTLVRSHFVALRQRTDPCHQIPVIRSLSSDPCHQIPVNRSSDPCHQIPVNRSSDPCHQIPVIRSVVDLVTMPIWNDSHLV